MNRTTTLLAGVAVAALLAAGCSHHHRATDATETPAPLAGGIHGERVGDLALDFDPGRGVMLRAFDVPVLSTSLLCVVSPGWGKQFYVGSSNRRMMEGATVEDHEGGRRLTIHHRLPEGADGSFSGVETHTLLPGNVYQVELDFIFESDEDAILEWRTGGFNPNLAAGMPFRAVTPSAVNEGTVPYTAPGAGVEECTVSRGFSTLTIDSRLGPVTIEADPADDLALFDYRRNRFAMDDNPMFWFGYLDRPIPSHERLTYSFTLRLPAEIQSQATGAPPARAEAAVSRTAAAREPHHQRDYLIPKPKNLEFTDEAMPLGTDTTIYVGADPGPGIESALAFLLRDLAEIYEVTPRVVRAAPPVPVPPGSILLGETSRFPAPGRMLAAAGLQPPPHPEGYALRVGDGVACVAAATDHGVFNGVTSLVQLVGTTPDGVGLRGARITDWPSLDFRGIHALSGKGAGGQISRAVRDLMARHKINSFVWECQYIVWDNAPELEHPEYGMKKEDARQVVDAARSHFIDLIPLVQSLGHSEWIFTNGHNLDIAEDPESPYAYMVTNPRTYEFIFSIYQEALDFFQPRSFHIGHDEVTMIGRFPHRSRDSGKTVTELVLEDTVRLNDWFRERNVDVFLWGDMFLYKGEAADATFAPTQEDALARRAGLPRDMTIADWHYDPVPASGYTSIPLWKDEGVRVVGAGWYTPANIHQLALACIRNDAYGYLQTTWAGFNFAIDGNEASWFQYWAYLLAAHYAWSGDETPPDQLPFSAKEEFLNAWYRTKPLLARRPGFLVDLSGVFNRGLVDPDGTQWLGFGPANDLRALPAGPRYFGETRFQVGTDPFFGRLLVVDPPMKQGDRSDASARGAVVLSGKMNPAGAFPDSVEVAIGDQPAAELRLLMTASFPTREHAEVGRVEVTLADGSVHAMPLLYGRNIFAFGDTRSGPAARVAWEGATQAGSAVRLWDVVWENPQPAKPVASVRLTSTGTEAAPILLAITGVAP